MRNGSKTKPVEPDCNQLFSLSLREEKSGFLEAALLHLWIPLEYKVKELVWNNQKMWPDGLDPRIKEIKNICNKHENAKLVIYSTSTIKKNKAETSGIELLNEKLLIYSVKDIRNKIVHEGMLLDEHVFNSCKTLVQSLLEYLNPISS